MKTYELVRKSPAVTKHEVANCGLFSVYRWYEGVAIVVINDARTRDIMWRNTDGGWVTAEYADEFPDIHAFLSIISEARLDHERVIEILSGFFNNLSHYKEATSK